MFKRQLLYSSGRPHIRIDPALTVDQQYTDNFGFEWSEIDGFAGKEVMSHGHLYGRFLLPADFMHGKVVADIGCGNGRLGRLIVPDCERYIGIDSSESIVAFPTYIDNFNSVTLVRASATDLPLENDSVDIAICWGVLHHIDDPWRAVDELIRVTKPGGFILVFVYSPNFDARRNFNQIIRELEHRVTFEIVEGASDSIDAWCEVDEFFGGHVANNVHMSRKHSREWQIFQWFDGISPKYHWSIANSLNRVADVDPILEDVGRGVFKWKKLKKDE